MKTFRSAYLQNLVSIIDNDDITSITVHGKVYEKVRSGKWIYEPKDAIEMMFTKPKCSICGYESSDALHYCSNCGAKITEVIK